ncbi:MAG: CAP domain-containing protein [Acidobacteriota bacterium]|nr:CAP domain-containing protein [Acidobacteriota bacterium]
MGALAADLERALGVDHVEINGRPSRASEPADRPATTFEAAVVDAMNRERAAHGLAPLGINSRLEAAADDRIADMLDKHYFSHVSPDGIQPWSWVDQRGYDYREVGENLALGYRSADSVVDGWMHSPGHRANVLGAHFREVGVAVSQVSPTTGYRGPTVVAIYGGR